MMDLPFELFYVLYKDRPIEQIVYVLVASLISNNYVEIENEAVVFTGPSLPHPIRKLFKRTKMNGNNIISWEKVDALTEYLFESLKERKFIFKLPIFGIIKTKRFRNFIRENMHLAKKDILSYILSGKIEHLNGIDERIHKTQFTFQVPDGFYSFYRDKPDAWRNAIGTTLGIVDLNRYKYYYTRSGEKREID